MGSLRTLNVYCPAEAVLGLLDVPVKCGSLPARCRCPLCKGSRLTIYEDTISGGPWHYCYDCHHSGDMIQLAAAYWNTSVTTAIVKLARLGIPLPEFALSQDELERYERTQPQMRARFAEFWEQSKTTLATSTSPGLCTLRFRLHINTALSSEAWLAGPGKLVGASTAREVERVFCPNTEYLGGHRKFFRGPGWKDVIVLPYYDMPGRPCGYLFVGRNGGPDDQVYKVPLAYGWGPTAWPREGGLFGLRAVHEAHICHGYAVAVEDPLIALRMQVEYCSDHAVPLPLLAWYDSPKVATKDAWRHLDRRVPIMCGWRMTPGLLLQAIRAEGMIHIIPMRSVSKERISHYMRLHEPATIVKRCVRLARPWREWIAKWAETAHEGEIEDVIIGLEAYQQSPQILEGLHDRIDALLDLPQSPRVVRLANNTQVMEKDGHWFLVRKGKTPALIMNAVLRLDNMVCLEDATIRYELRLVMDGKEIPFSVKDSSLRNNKMAAILQANARKHDCPRLYIESGWQGRLVKIAEQIAG